MRGFLFDVEFMWGFQTRIAGMSKTSLSYIFPPPTTVLGSLAEPYSKRRKLSEGRSVQTMINLSRNLLALGYRFVNAIPVAFQDLNRVFALGTRGGIKYPSTKDVYGSFDAPARGKTILSSIDNDELPSAPPRLRVMMVFKENADIDVRDIWEIRRIGSRESLVSVVDVVEKSPRIIRDYVTTKHLLPLINGIEIIDEEGEFSDLFFVPLLGNPLIDSPPKLYLESYVVKHRIGIPYHDYYIKIKLPSGYVGYEINQEVVVGIES